MNENKKYCVTAINRLTGQREIISGACNKENADAIRARLQTIPDWYKWEVSETQQYKMLGNG